MKNLVVVLRVLAVVEQALAVVERLVAMVDGGQSNCKADNGSQCLAHMCYRYGMIHTHIYIYIYIYTYIYIYIYICMYAYDCARDITRNV